MIKIAIKKNKSQGGNMNRHIDVRRLCDLRLYVYKTFLSHIHEKNKRIYNKCTN